MEAQNVSISIFNDIISRWKFYRLTFSKIQQFHLLIAESDIKSPLSSLKLNIESSFKGIELVFPISRDNYYELIEGFQNKKVNLFKLNIINLIQFSILK